MPSKHIIGEALTLNLQTSERASQIKIQNVSTFLHSHRQWNKVPREFYTAYS